MLSTMIKDMNLIHSILNVTYKLAIMLYIIFLLISILFPKEFMMLFTNDKYVINQGIKYICIVSISYIFIHWQFQQVVY